MAGPSTSSMYSSQLQQNERILCESLLSLPKRYHYRYSEKAAAELLRILFRSLVGFQNENLKLLFPEGPPTDISKKWSLRDAQGATNGAEYTEAARDHPCGHIFRNGESTYRCKTCTLDDTCVLCAKCFEASDHEGHAVFVSISPGNSGCCDCGDEEAWVRPIICTIHAPLPNKEDRSSSPVGPAPTKPQIPPEIAECFRMTISRIYDFYCDVFSCSPEQQRLPKTYLSIKENERLSRFSSQWFFGSEPNLECDEFALIVWNDEKHTVNDVKDQLARACRLRNSVCLRKAFSIDEVGRNIILFSDDVRELMAMAEVIERIKLTVTIRSSRDTFMEEMCATMIEFLNDISGCTVGSQPLFLRQIICEELLKEWQKGSNAHHAVIGKDGIDDHASEDYLDDDIVTLNRSHMIARRNAAAAGGETAETDTPTPTGGENMELDEDSDAPAVEIDNNDALENREATLAGYPPPPFPPIHLDNRQGVISEDGQFRRIDTGPGPYLIPPTPKQRAWSTKKFTPESHWLVAPSGFGRRENMPVRENLWLRLRIDYMILFDLRMWKRLRIDMRDLLISSVVTLPKFKRVMGLRFAGLYTLLAQLYLIADREPDHSIIYLSLQILTAPSITLEVIQMANFFTRLLAIIYTFITTRQVGYPWNIDPQATLVFENGSMTNRRVYHFFLDLKYLLNSEQVQRLISSEPQYLLQFLDIIKLHHGICPVERATNAHVEYETDLWVSASLVTREINKLCRQFCESFQWGGTDSSGSGKYHESSLAVMRAIRVIARTTVINSLGAEHKRFSRSELSSPVCFYDFPVSMYNRTEEGGHYSIVKCSVAKSPMSFHHPLHFTLSWAIDRGKMMSASELLQLFEMTVKEVRTMSWEPATVENIQIPDLTFEQYMLAMFDIPIRLCAWLAQIRAGMWVRNGASLRHQMSNHRSVSQREMTYQREIFLIQTAFALCRQDVILASVIDRFDMLPWVSGQYDQVQDRDEDKMLEIAGEFVHFLIVILSDRTPLEPGIISGSGKEGGGQTQKSLMIHSIRRDIAHVLCMKPLPYSEITNKIPEKVHEIDEFPAILEEMTRFRAPEGVSDNGTFELKPEYLSLVDPYWANYTQNQKEEAENILKAYLARKTGQEKSEVVFVPELMKITHGVFVNMPKFTQKPYMAQIIYFLLGYCKVRKYGDCVSPRKVESFLHLNLYLTILCILEDNSQSPDQTEDDHEGGETSFLTMALVRSPSVTLDGYPTILSLLYAIRADERYSSAKPKINFIIQKMKEIRREDYEVGMSMFEHPEIEIENSSATSEAERKEILKKEALSRQAKVMDMFKRQQQQFLENQHIDWGVDDEDNCSDEEMDDARGGQRVRPYPQGTCILCQEETSDNQLYGIFAHLTASRIFRQTEVLDEAWVREVVDTPLSLDRSAEHIRPFGVCGQNKQMLRKFDPQGNPILVERQVLSRGFPAKNCGQGSVATGCGHMMHFSCHVDYLEGIRRRHITQVARLHPERAELGEYLCPLCKALGNVFLPVIWKPKRLVRMEDFVLDCTLDEWLTQMDKFEWGPPDFVGKSYHVIPEQAARETRAAKKYITEHMIPSLAPALLSDPGLLHQLETRFNVIRSSIGKSEAPPPVELVNSYLRVTRVIKSNSISAQYSYITSSGNPASDPILFTDVMAQTLGYSIAAVEIAQRGVEAFPWQTLLSKINSQTLTNLSVLAETVRSYLAVGKVRTEASALAGMEQWDRLCQQVARLFIGLTHVQLRSEQLLETTDLRPLLAIDPFIFLAECSVGMISEFEIPAFGIVRLCYLAEVVRVVLAFVDDEEGVGTKLESYKDITHPEKAACTLEQERDFILFVEGIIKMLQTTTWVETATSSTIRAGAKFLRTAVLTYSLTFLRKVVILMHCRFGLEFPCEDPESSFVDNELVRLQRLLKLPSLDEMVQEVLQLGARPSALRDVISGWLRHWAMLRRDRARSSKVFGMQVGRESKVPTGAEAHATRLLALSRATLGHPAIFELAGLPKCFDVLTDEAFKRKCPSTGRELTDPTVCLFCGEIFCSQGVCCLWESRIGGCNRHQERCGGQVGMYLNLRKCTAVFLSGGGHLGSWFLAPYLDRHGEPDPSLRRQLQLFLSRSRYEALFRNVWFSHGIPSVVARRLDAESNTGGWETL